MVHQPPQRYTVNRAIPDHELLECPGCGNLSFAIRKTTIVCPVCRKEGEMHNGTVSWSQGCDFDDFQKMQKTHYGWTAQGNEAFREQFRKIAEARVAFRSREEEIPIVTRDNPS